MTDIRYLHKENRRFVAGESKKLADQETVIVNLCRQLSDMQSLSYEKRWRRVSDPINIFTGILLYVGGLLFASMLAVSLLSPPNGLGNLFFGFVFAPFMSFSCFAMAISGTWRIYLVIKKCRDDYLNQMVERLITEGQVYEAEITEIKSVPYSPYFAIHYTFLDQDHRPPKGSYDTYVGKDHLHVGNKIYVLQFEEARIVL